MYRKVDVPFSLFEVELDKAEDEELMAISRESGVGLSLDEMKRLKAYFAEKGRNPTDVEFQAIGQAWSEHCCYKTSRPILREFVFGIDSHKVLSRGDAGVMEFDDEAALESYQVHPEHVRFRDELLAPLVDEKLVFDYEV